MRENFKKKFNVSNNPVIVTFLSFVVLILFGFILLCLPISFKNNHPTSLFKSFFVSTSATCITCFTMGDTISGWSMFGKTIILILIQVGGIGLISFSSIFSLSINKKLSLKNMKLANSQISMENFTDIQKIIKNIIIITFFCELVGVIVLCFPYCKRFGLYGIFMAMVASVSAYCNAGFDLKGFLCPNCSYDPIKDSPTAMIVLCILTLAGGFGFIIINEILKLKKSKRKLKFLSIHSKVAILVSFALLFFGAIVMLALEWNNTLSGMNFAKKAAVSTFNSISARSSGFAVINFIDMLNLTKYFMSFLMFIGACPSGTGGGIKTTTFAILIKTTFCAIRNRDNVTIFNRKINKTIVYKSVALFFIYAITIVISTILINSFNPEFGLTNILFTTTSAFSTTGIQLIDTSLFSDCSKLVLIFLMFVGRVGPLLFAALIFNFIPANSNKQFAMPEGKIYIC